MLISYWCPACHALHGNDAIRQPETAGGPWRCRVTGAAVVVRGIPDDPDDPAYGTPRCRLCQAAVKNPASPCPECGTPPG
ncbi:MAG: hypothetical protein K0Q55_140 [Verrucomicrobia bacterium]|jgi:hypothetical protein|nr:hypothetical protein [Verrucomicrobiota bacterium]